MRTLIWTLGAILLTTTGCVVAPTAQRPPSEPVSGASDGSQRMAAPMAKVERSAVIPKRLTYEIISERIIPGVKRDIDVRLSQKISADDLRSIAIKLRNADPNRYERTFIGYYLPGMEIGAGSWATTHFNPNLDVQILGLTTSQEKLLTQHSDDTSRETIGVWLDERLFLESRITIFREKGKLFMEYLHKDGSSGKREIVERDSPLGRRFERIGGSSAGDHQIIDSSGNLQFRDNEGLIGTAKRIQ